MSDPRPASPTAAADPAAPAAASAAPTPTSAADRIRKRLALVMAVGHEARTKHGPAIRQAAGTHADNLGREARQLAARMAEHPHALDPADAAALRQLADLRRQHEAIALEKP